MSSYFRIMLRLHTCSLDGLFLRETYLASAKEDHFIVGKCTLPFLQDLSGQSRLACHVPLLTERGGEAALFGIYSLIWSTGRGGLLPLTLSPNCSFDTGRQDTQSEGEPCWCLDLFFDLILLHGPAS
ncbi:hypothetical protein XENOCAPTIV_029193 [Xenoophorus captivus]|uniref:Uncharacterized protein n=1 Tax=Xenoophorus captivus TaxID=1517983 RepID=A0ABV0R764_9TELE